VRRRWWRRWLAVALGMTFLVGCERAAVRQPYPPDPLFLSRKPVAGKVETAQPVLACSEPAVPPLPPAAVASAPRQHGVPFDPSSAVAHDSSAARPNVPAAPPAAVQKTTALASTRSTDQP
jgi:hypothetical protein